MPFNSLQYLIFLPLTTAAFYAIPPRSRNLFLLAASYFFYMCWRAEYALLIATATLTSFVAARLVERYREDLLRRRLVLCGAMGVVFALLFVFKYLDFANANLRELFRLVGVGYDVPRLDLLLPVGISFYTFQVASYLADVYRGETPAERDLSRYAVYVSFFPQLVAGPIERARHLLPQLAHVKRFDPIRARTGVALIVWGLFKKIVIADRLAAVVDPIYANPTAFTGLPLAIAASFFAFQVYCDFSSYSDIAIGSARLLGIELTLNFDRPYLAGSLSDFWRRWHITLSSWLSDYIYMPVAIRVRSAGRFSVVLAIGVTFVASGFWHGAAWTFVLWGIIHGAGLGVEALTVGLRRKVRQRLPAGLYERVYGPICICCVFLFVAFSDVFFRAESVADAIYIVSHVASGFGSQLASLGALGSAVASIGVDLGEMQITAVLLVLFVAFDLCVSDPFDVFVARLPGAARWTAYYAVCTGIVFFGSFGTTRQFIYFQF